MNVYLRSLTLLIGRDGIYLGPELPECLPERTTRSSEKPLLYKEPLESPGVVAPPPQGVVDFGEGVGPNLLQRQAPAGSVISEGRLGVMKIMRLQRGCRQENSVCSRLP